MTTRSPFTSSVFKPSGIRTVREVYKERIEKIYAVAYKKEENKENEVAAGEGKLQRALQLLDTEYVGREQDLYELIYKKYAANIDDIVMESEFMPSRYTCPLVSEYLITEHGDAILCSECLQSFQYTEFPEDELNNGAFLACKRCAPDRNNVVELKWHAQYKSDAVLLENNGYNAKVTTSNHKYCLVDQPGVVKGVHCWRWCTRHYQTWFMWGISNRKKHTDASYSNKNVFGIAGSNQSYKNGACVYDVQTNVFFGGKTEVIIDMLLDLNKGELCFKIPGNESEAKMTGIPKDDPEGWVPHCNMHYANATAQVKRIPTNWYGKNIKRVKF
mmetsp:Transcript_38321/g.62818  ORF Transcript_38321/g.62818 Transcript_38321/m.62818 type:complete len:330 (+) Transcript_38321:25-1014(+)